MPCGRHNNLARYSNLPALRSDEDHLLILFVHDSVSIIQVLTFRFLRVYPEELLICPSQLLECGYRNEVLALTVLTIYSILREIRPLMLFPTIHPVQLIVKSKKGKLELIGSAVVDWELSTET